MPNAKIKPFLWFDNNLDDAIKFYKSVFKSNFKLIHASRVGGKSAPIFMAEFTIFKQPYVALNGGPMFKFNESISMYISCVDQKEVDKYWKALTSNGGEEGRCGWLKDKFGLSWQVIPKDLPKYMGHKNPEVAAYAQEQMMKMNKIIVKDLKMKAVKKKK